LTVDGARRGEDESPDPGRPHRIEEIERADDIRPVVELRLGHRFGHERERGEMKDAVEPPVEGVR
jgi:hypothetical protein